MDKTHFNPENLKAHAPVFFGIAREARNLGSLRERLAAWIHQVRFDTYHEQEPSQGNEIIRIRDCSRFLQSILATRSDHLAGFSVARAIRDIARDRARPDLTPAFYADLLHMLLGLSGEGPGTSLDDALLMPSELTGREAAIERSHQLDELGRTVWAMIDRYATGLDAEVIQARQARRRRVLEALGGDESNWMDWRWQIGHVIRSPELLRQMVWLSEEEVAAIDAAHAGRIPFGVTPHYVALMDDQRSGRDRSIRYQVIPPGDYVEGMGRLRAQDPALLDFMREMDTSPQDLITRRYPGICILKPVNTCPQVCVYCQRNWEIEDAMDPEGFIPENQVDQAIDWIERHPAIREVLVTGGDPFVLTDEQLEHLVGRLAAIDSVERIRIGTRMLVTCPMRVTEALAGLLGRYRQPGRREVCIVTHFQHVYEVTPESVEAIGRLRAQRIGVYNQTVYTFPVSRRFEVSALRRLLRLVGVDPYYTFNTKGKDEMKAYRVPMARLMQEQKEEARLLPGLARTDEAVYNVPGAGKNYLRARQHRNLLSILPNGSRVYEFHPWEKNITRAIQPYVGVDVPILEYLERLEAIGEDVAEYQTIWYYF
jgi:lysine 2,3-aminomutase